MNFLYPEHLGELNRQKIEKDRMYILKEEMLKDKSQVTQTMVGLGKWMTMQGEKLQKKYSASKSSQKPFFMQDESKILRA